MGYSPATDALMEGAIDALKRMGAVIVDPADITTAGQFDDSEFAVLLYEFKADLNKYLGEWAPTAGAKTLEDLIAFNERTKEDRKSTRLNSSHGYISYAVFCLKKK